MGQPEVLLEKDRNLHGMHGYTYVLPNLEDVTRRNDMESEIIRWKKHRGKRGKD